jgi:hypothetical protein
MTNREPASTKTPRAGTLAAIEAIGSLAWFLMDGCWMLGLGGVARALVVPTVLAHWAAFRYTERSLVDMAVTASVNCWVLMNVLWMVADLEQRPALLGPARAALAAGIVLLLLAGFRARATGELLKQAFGRFRRLRMPTR